MSIYRERLKVCTRRFCISAFLPVISVIVLAGPARPALARPHVDMSAVAPDPKNELVNLRYVNEKIGEGFKIKRSLHYSIIYNTSEEDVAVFEYAIEKTYRACMKWCISMGIDVHPPTEKLITHFFNDFSEYQKYSVIMGSPVSGPGTAGFYHPMTDYSYFYNFRNTPGFKNAKTNIDQQISQLADMLRRGDIPSEQKKAIRQQIRKLRAVQNSINTFGGDTTEEVLQHEVSHQVLFNIGFHNRRAALNFANPRWFAEGMAQLFEPIDTGGGSGFGKVNKDKAAMFHQLVKTNRLYPVDKFVSDIKYFFGGDVAGIAYPESWALAHYLTRTKRTELQAYIKEINARTGDYEMNPEKDLEIFEKYFGKVDKAWMKRFTDYMDRVN